MDTRSQEQGKHLHECGEEMEWGVANTCVVCQGVEGGMYSGALISLHMLLAARFLPVKEQINVRKKKTGMDVGC